MKTFGMQLQYASGKERQGGKSPLVLCVVKSYPGWLQNLIIRQMLTLSRESLGFQFTVFPLHLILWTNGLRIRILQTLDIEILSPQVTLTITDLKGEVRVLWDQNGPKRKIFSKNFEGTPSQLRNQHICFVLEIFFGGVRNYPISRIFDPKLRHGSGTQCLNRIPWFKLITNK